MLYVQRFNVRQVSHAPRSVQTGSFRSHEIEIITGYDAIHDRYPVHVRVHRAGEPWRRLDTAAIAGDDECDAFEKGWKFVAEWTSGLAD
ncbi:MAG: hypothetical protein PGN26_04285 [Xylophilus ampelinus]